MHRTENTHCNTALHIIDSIESEIKALKTLNKKYGTQEILTAISEAESTLTTVAAIIEKEAPLCD